MSATRKELPVRRLLPLLLVLAGLGLVAGSPAPAFACSCAMADLADRVQRSDAVFAGTLRDSATDGRVASYAVRVTDAFGADLPATVEVRSSTDEASCGLAPPPKGKEAVWFTTLEGDHLTSNLCSGTGVYDAARTDRIAELLRASPRPAVALPEAPSPPAPEPSWVRPARMLFAGVIAAGLVVTAVVWRRRRRLRG